MDKNKEFTDKLFSLLGEYNMELYPVMKIEIREGSPKPSNINQTHTGSGDNIAGSKGAAKKKTTKKVTKKKK